MAEETEYFFMAIDHTRTCHLLIFVLFAYMLFPLIGNASGRELS